MHRESLLIVLGVLIGVSPYMGLPYSWLMVILPAFGVLVLAIGLSTLMRRRAYERERVSQPNDQAHPAV